MRRVIAIDGPSGAGKSTVARYLAERLGFQYLDTGSLYRAVALHLRREGFDENSPDSSVKEALRNVDIYFRDGRAYLNGEDVSEEIRSTEMGHYSSVFSARKPVREFLLGVQRSYPEMYDTVVEGRDMGTVVFPGAWRKFFLDAGQGERAKRRFLQLNGQGKGTTMEEALRDVIERDMRDSSRDIAPLRLAPDAHYIDTTSLSFEETLKKIMEFL